MGLRDNSKMLPRDIVSHVLGDDVAGFKLMEINKPVAAFQEVRHVKMEVQSNPKIHMPYPNAPWDWKIYLHFSAEIFYGKCR